jgi:hypothetical protein
MKAAAITSSRIRRGSASALGLAIGVSLLAGCGRAVDATSQPTPSPSSGTIAPGPAATWTVRRVDDPARVRVLDAQGGVLATFTNGARTVDVRGPLRIFAEPATTSATVRSTTWVRLLPRPFDGRVDRAWLARKLRDTSPDVLEIAMQYVTGAPPVRNHQGLVISGDAGFGPIHASGSRSEGSDFNDYLGIPWSYGGVTDPAEHSERGMLDCSGFLRMVFGYRSGIPLALGPSTTALPRVAAEIMAQGPGVLLEADRGAIPSFKRLQPGDMLFFDRARHDGIPINHSGIYLGRDQLGRMRFVSSRKLADGPSMGDAGGESVLTRDEHAALRWRAARRI